MAVRRPGRPRDAGADSLILEAALELFVEAGFEGMSMEGVAARAGVAKTTIYRRWASKEELAGAAIGTLYEDLELPDAGNARVDLVAIVRQIHGFMTGAAAGRVFPRMVGEVAAGTPLGRAYVERVVAPRRMALATVVERAMRRGDTRPDLDVQLVVDSIIGTLLFRRLTGTLAGNGDDLAERLVDQLVVG